MSGEQDQRSCWFDVDSSLPEPPNLDFALLASIGRAMANGEDLHLAGNASFAMLANLEHYVDIWTSWLPKQYRPISISADTIDQALTSEALVRPPAILAFSGGLDSAATLARQAEGLAKRSTVDVQSLMLVQGLDFPLDATHAFNHARASIELQAKPFGLPVSIVATNWRREFQTAWVMEFPLAVAACLHLHAGAYPAGLFSEDIHYAELAETIPWGSNRLSNLFLSGGRFDIRTDGAAMTRCEKAGIVSRYRTLQDNLRVCWAGPKTGKNCGKCEKCVRTQLNFIVLGLDPGPAFPRRLLPADILKIDVSRPIHLSLLEEIYAEASRRGLVDDRIETLRSLIEEAAAKELPPRVNQTTKGNGSTSLDVRTPPATKPKPASAKKSNAQHAKIGVPKRARSTSSLVSHGKASIARLLQRFAHLRS